MLIQMLGVFAQFEREILIDRVINALERKATKGEWCGGKVPHGYELNRDTKKLMIAAGEDLAVKAMFETFTKKRLGTKEVAKDLNQRGYRTRSGRRWSGNTVLAMLRNRTYLGEVYYRGTWHRADGHHPAIIDTSVFDHTQRILDQRSEDYSQRASANSDYALTGEIKCDHCGAHYVGTAATRRNGRYRYYTCYTRQRYGPESCPADRLPADEVEDKMLGALIDTYHQTDIIQEAIMAVAAQTAAAQHDRQKMIAVVEADLVEITSKIDRYLNAFENNTMTEATAGDRVAQLKERAHQLKSHREELASAGDDDPQPVDLTAADLDDMRDEIVQLLNHGAPGAKNALFRALIHEIQVTGRHRIKPYFRVPANSRTPDQGSEVRIVTDWAPRLGLEPRTCRLTAGCSAN